MRKEWRAKKKAEQAARKKAHEEEEDDIRHEQSGGDGTSPNGEQRDEEEADELDSPRGDFSSDSLPSATSTHQEIPSPIRDHHLGHAEASIFQYSVPSMPAYHSYVQPSLQEHHHNLHQSHLDSMRPQTAPSSMDMFAYHAPSPTSHSPTIAQHSQNRQQSSPFKSYAEDPALSSSVGMLGLPQRRRGSLPASAHHHLDAILEMAPAQFSAYHPSALHHSAPSPAPPFGHEWSAGSPMYHSRTPSQAQMAGGL